MNENKHVSPPFSYYAKSQLIDQTVAAIQAASGFPNGICLLRMPPTHLYRKVWAFAQLNGSFTATDFAFDLVSTLNGCEVFRMPIVKGLVAVDKFFFGSSFTTQTAPVNGPSLQIFIGAGATSYIVVPHTLAIACDEMFLDMKLFNLVGAGTITVHLSCLSQNISLF